MDADMDILHKTTAGSVTVMIQGDKKGLMLCYVPITSPRLAGEQNLPIVTGPKQTKISIPFD